MAEDHLMEELTHARVEADRNKERSSPHDGQPTEFRGMEPGSDADIADRVAEIASRADSKLGASSKATTANPKDLYGSQKISFTKVSAIAIAHCAMAMMDGARKYGPYNWRDKPVIASIYIDAGTRHRLAWFEGQEVADDSKVHHLGHSMACDAIILDAQAHGVLIDDRPNGKGVLSEVMERMATVLKEQAEDRKTAAGKS